MRLFFLLLAAVSAAQVDPRTIRTVHVVQACHVDMGFGGTIAGIVNEWFDTYFPRIISVAEQLREANSSSGAALKFMTQSYLVSLYLDCPAGLGLHCPNASSIAGWSAFWT